MSCEVGTREIIFLFIGFGTTVICDILLRTNAEITYSAGTGLSALHIFISNT